MMCGQADDPTQHDAPGCAAHRGDPQTWCASCRARTAPRADDPFEHAFEPPLLAALPLDYDANALWCRVCGFARDRHPA